MFKTRFYLVISLVLATNYLFSQVLDCPCSDDLNEVAELIKQSKSYKDQIKGRDRIAAFDQWKNQIEEELSADSLSSFFCTGYLQKYISFIRDRHNRVYFIPEQPAANAPTYAKPFAPQQYGHDSITGIYHLGADSIFLKNESDSIWYGITLNTASEIWPKGTIRLRVQKLPNGRFDIFEYYDNGMLMYHTDVAISGGRIHATYWNKDNHYFFNKAHEASFTYEAINPDLDYIGITTFKRTKALMQEAEKFYASHLGTLTKPHVIIDLRNNGGGAILQAEPLIKSLKRNSHIKHIYVMVNFLTASAAELVALELKEDQRTSLVGENSKGMVEYGYGNKATTTTTPCSGFQVVLSTKHDGKRSGRYEGVGITPDHYLDNRSSWVEQVLELEAERQ